MRVAIAVNTPPGTYPALPLAADAADLTFTTADPANDHDFIATGKEILLVNNTDAGAQTVTILSAADPSFGRTGDITTYSIGAGEMAMFGPFKATGWHQSDGKVHVDVANANLELAIVRFP